MPASRPPAAVDPRQPGATGHLGYHQRSSHQAGRSAGWRSRIGPVEPHRPGEPGHGSPPDVELDDLVGDEGRATSWPTPRPCWSCPGWLPRRRPPPAPRAATAPAWTRTCWLSASMASNVSAPSSRDTPVQRSVPTPTRLAVPCDDDPVVRRPHVDHVRGLRRGWMFSDQRGDDSGDRRVVAAHQHRRPEAVDPVLEGHRHRRRDGRGREPGHGRSRGVVRAPGAGRDRGRRAAP